MSEQGEGSRPGLTDAFRSRGGAGRGVAGSQREASGRASQPTSPPARRGRQKTGKRSNPDYKLAPAYVREEMHDRVMQALRDPAVKDEVLGELAEWGVAHKAGKPSYSDLTELLLVQWLERVGWYEQGER
ncbi:hypothetical protein BH20ACT11_BH20ACT11_11070 [soil metagenome]|jgi:hypothetical protein